MYILQTVIDTLRKEKRRAKDLRNKELQDPLTEMKRHVSQGSSQTKLKEKTKSSSTAKTIEQLRAERLERETQERAKAQALLDKGKPPELSSTFVKHQQESSYYHSQFNPEFIRKSSRKEDVRRKPY